MRLDTHDAILIGCQAILHRHSQLATFFVSSNYGMALNRSLLPLVLVVMLSVSLLFHFEATSIMKRARPYIKPIPPVRTRDDLGKLLESEGFTVGIELGVQSGYYSKTILSHWKSCERYYLVDIWQQQENYMDGANVNNHQQESLFKGAQALLKPWQDKAVFLRKYTSQAVHDVPDNSVDFVYVDARHDYCGATEDIELYWPKLKAGGLMTGHDYKLASEGPAGDDWSVCADGSKHPGAVRGAVDEFAAKHGFQVVVTYRDDWNTWMIRKPGVNQ